MATTTVTENPGPCTWCGLLVDTQVNGKYLCGNCARAQEDLQRRRKDRPQ